MSISPSCCYFAAVCLIMLQRVQSQPLALSFLQRWAYNCQLLSSVFKRRRNDLASLSAPRGDEDHKRGTLGNRNTMMFIQLCDYINSFSLFYKKNPIVYSHIFCRVLSTSASFNDNEPAHSSQPALWCLAIE